LIIFYDRLLAPKPRLIVVLALKRVCNCHDGISDGLAQDIQQNTKSPQVVGASDRCGLLANVR